MPHAQIPVVHKSVLDSGWFWSVRDSGFRGNGENCTDNDECANGSHTCDYNAICSNNVGSYTCECVDGFTGDGKTCTDGDECSLVVNLTLFQLFELEFLFLFFQKFNFIHQVFDCDL